MGIKIIMNDCIFCKIVKGEIPSAKVYEDSDFFAFLDIDPVSKGHTLLVPKKHIRWIYDADETLYKNAFILAKNLVNRIKMVLYCDYVQLVITGEQVAHAHIHFIPSYFGKETAKWNKTAYTSETEMAEYVQKIKF